MTSRAHGHTRALSGLVELHRIRYTVRYPGAFFDEDAPVRHPPSATRLPPPDLKLRSDWLGCRRESVSTGGVAPRPLKRSRQVCSRNRALPPPALGRSSRDRLLPCSSPPSNNDRMRSPPPALSQTPKPPPPLLCTATTTPTLRCLECMTSFVDHPIEYDECMGDYDPDWPSATACDVKAAQPCCFDLVSRGNCLESGYFLE